MDQVLKKLFGTTKIDWSDNETFSKIKEYVDTDIQEKLNNHVADFVCEHFHTPERRIQFKREKISSEGDFLTKKHYAVHVKDNEGLACDKFSFTGIDIAKNELPEKIKSLLQNLVQDMMKNKWVGEAEIQPRLREIYNQYSSFEMKDIGFIKNLSTPKNTISETLFMSEKGAGVHARSANNYNQLVDLLNLNNKCEKIKQSDRFQYVYLKTDNKFGIDCIAWKDRYPNEFREIFEVDYKAMFEKTIISPMKKFLENHKGGTFVAGQTMLTENLFDL